MWFLSPKGTNMNSPGCAAGDTQGNRHTKNSTLKGSTRDFRLNDDVGSTLPGLDAELSGNRGLRHKCCAQPSAIHIRPLWGQQKPEILWLRSVNNVGLQGGSGSQPAQQPPGVF